ncbi:HEPN-associated N-terminal domain-containing protein [Dyella sp. 20L07]|uniref:HEPN-associated N-terminal domain-containing protein n=1 Tax=Dyella sp. 20L07 TaxID=3384240 RepID=UPI003D26E29C
MKEDWLNDQERGWHESDKHACPRCVGDSYLKKIVRSDLTSPRCDYCGRRSHIPIAASINVLLEVIYPAVNAYFNEPSDAGVPWDEGEYQVEGWSMGEILESLGFDGHADLVQDVIDAEANDAGWVPAAGGHWASSHEHDLLLASWRAFAHTVKHVTRFHFSNMPPSESNGPGDIDIRDWLPALGKQLKPLVTTLPVGTEVFRARIQSPDHPWRPTGDQLTAPPPEKATAGRMNPAGIRYLYTAFDKATALREVGIMNPPTDPVYVASFTLTRPLRVVNLTKGVLLPSSFDLGHKGKRERVLFIRGFIRAISAPVIKDSREHLDYVPSQVVCEYLAQVFQTKGGERLGGLIFPSSVHEGGRNLVVFPSEEHFTQGFHGVTFNRAAQHLFEPASS